MSIPIPYWYIVPIIDFHPSCPVIQPITHLGPSCAQKYIGRTSKQHPRVRSCCPKCRSTARLCCETPAIATRTLLDRPVTVAGKQISWKLTQLPRREQPRRSEGTLPPLNPNVFKNWSTLPHPLAEPSPCHVGIISPDWIPHNKSLMDDKLSSTLVPALGQRKARGSLPAAGRAV